MERTLAFIVGILLALWLATTARKMMRLKLLNERTDAVCGETNERAGGPTDRTIVERSVMPLLEVLGLAADTPINRAYIALVPLAFGLSAAVAGWKLSVFGIFVLGIVHLALAKWQSSKRSRQFADRLPAFLERVRRLIMTGNTLPQAFVEAVATADPVVKAQIDPFVRRIRFGASFSDSIEMLARQNEIAELHMLSAYVKTNAKYGGKVAQTLSNLIAQLSNKRRLEREIRAATAETRASAAILCGLMVFLILAMSALNPEYVRFFFSSDRGRLIFAAIAAWPLLGILVMRKILKLDH